VTPSPDKQKPETKIDPLSDEEYLQRRRQFGIADSGIWPSMAEVKAAYPEDHEFDAGQGRTVKMADLPDD